jgi:hypothetical protein
MKSIPLPRPLLYLSLCAAIGAFAVLVKAGVSLRHTYAALALSAGNSENVERAFDAGLKIGVGATVALLACVIFFRKVK